MSDEAVEQILDRVDRLGELGGDAFETLIKQVYIEGATAIVWALVLFGLVFVGLKILKNLGAFKDEPRWMQYDHLDNGMAKVFTSLGTLAAGLVGFGFVNMAVRRFAHPEFWALKYLLERL